MRTKVSERGQVVIPKRVRDKLGIARGQALDVQAVDGTVVMKPVPSEAVAAPTDWRQWAGFLKGTDALKDLEAEHRREIERGR